MPVRVALLPDNTVIEFDKGLFDNWCVYLHKPKQKRYAPKDIEYFSHLKLLGTLYGCQNIYNDFVTIYEQTTHVTDNKIIDEIIQLSGKYTNHQKQICIWFTILYAGMVAEENKQNAILKKRIKRLGLHQVLIQNMKPEFAANFSKGKNWKELDAICKTYHF